MGHLRLLLKRYWRWVAIAVGLIVVARLVVPCPIQGNWVGRSTGHLCEDHAFLRYTDGYAAYYHGSLDPDYLRIYEKTGWNTYSVRFSPSDDDPDTLHVGWLFMRTTIRGRHHWDHRDFRIVEGRRMVRAAKDNARLVRERVDTLSPGMPAPEVWANLGLSSRRTPERSAYLTQDVYHVRYLLSPVEFLYCDWDMTTNPPVLLEASYTNWASEAWERDGAR
jgi:hypothetical protein